MTKLYAVGYTVGRVLDKDKCYVYLGEKMNQFSEAAYKLWAIFLGGKTTEEAEKSYEKISNNGESDFNQGVKELIRRGFLIEQEDLLDAFIQRQGDGIGMYGEDDYVVLNGKAVHIPYAAYMIWCQSDGAQTLRDRADQMRNRRFVLSDQEVLSIADVLLKLKIAQVIG